MAAAGMILVHDGRVLLLKRAAGSDAGGTWGFPGGGIEPGETAEQAARREYGEECCTEPYAGALEPLYVTEDGFTCFGGIGDGSEPKLNDEHTAAVWAPFDALPSPLHPSTVAELSKSPARRALDALSRTVANIR
jgi:ADP-ribose pyrophosphatase YjhB (NUDIX family)